MVNSHFGNRINHGLRGWARVRKGPAGGIRVQLSLVRDCPSRAWLKGIVLLGAHGSLASWRGVSDRDRPAGRFFLIFRLPSAIYVRIMSGLSMGEDVNRGMRALFDN